MFTCLQRHYFIQLTIVGSLPIFPLFFFIILDHSYQLTNFPWDPHFRQFLVKGAEKQNQFHMKNFQQKYSGNNGCGPRKVKITVQNAWNEIITCLTHEIAKKKATH